MKALFALCVVLSTMTAMVSATPFSFCPSGAGWMENAEIKAVTPLCAGCKVKFSISGTLPRPLEAAADYHSYSDIKVFGSSVKNTDTAICAPESPFKCPEAIGSHTWIFEMDIPSLGFSYDVDAETKIQKAGDASDMLLCFIMKAQIS